MLCCFLRGFCYFVTNVTNLSDWLLERAGAAMKQVDGVKVKLT